MSGRGTDTGSVMVSGHRWHWSVPELQALWKAWADYADPDAQVALDAALTYQKFAWAVPPVFSWQSDFRIPTASRKLPPWDPFSHSYKPLPKPEAETMVMEAIKGYVECSRLSVPSYSTDAFLWSTVQHHIWLEHQKPVADTARVDLIRTVIPVVCTYLLPWETDNLYVHVPNPTWLDWAEGFRNIDRKAVFLQRQKSEGDKSK